MQHVLDASVETAGSQVGIHLVLVLIGLGFHASLVQNGFGIGFLDGALLVANGFAFQRSDVGGDAGAFLGHVSGWAGEQLAGEVDDFFAGRGDGHRGDHAVEFIGLEARNHPVEIAFDPFALDLQLGTDCVTQIDVEPHQAAVGRFRLERCVGRVNAKTQFFVFLCHGGASGHAQRQCRKGQQCFFHYLFPKTNMSACGAELLLLVSVRPNESSNFRTRVPNKRLTGIQEIAGMGLVHENGRRGRPALFWFFGKPITRADPAVFPDGQPLRPACPGASAAFAETAPLSRFYAAWTGQCPRNPVQTPGSVLR
ncbi:hypothetical protein D3C72_660860 [compost metagenome]